MIQNREDIGPIEAQMLDHVKSVRMRLEKGEGYQARQVAQDTGAPPTVEPAPQFNRYKRRRRSERDFIDVSHPDDYELGMPHRAESLHWKLILIEVCEKHQVQMTELLSGRRNRYLVAARREAATRMAAETDMNYPAIGRRLRQHHTSVMYLLGKVKGRANAQENIDATGYGNRPSHQEAMDG